VVRSPWSVVRSSWFAVGSIAMDYGLRTTDFIWLALLKV